MTPQNYHAYQKQRKPEKCHSQEEPKEMEQLHVAGFPTWTPTTEKGR